MAFPVPSSELNALELFNDGEDTLAAVELHTGPNMLHLAQRVEIVRKGNGFNSLSPNCSARAIQPCQQVPRAPSPIGKFNG